MNNEITATENTAEVPQEFKIKDILFLVLTILPVVVALVLRVLFTPASEGISITGALVYFTVPMPLQNMPISEAQVNSLLVVLSVLGLCLYLTHGIRAGVPTKRQYLCEWAVEKVDAITVDNMGEFFRGYSPFIAAILIISAFSSLLSLFGVFAPTSDINIVAGWAILVFALITYYKFKCGPIRYMKSFTEPVAFLTPINVISEVATPISMAFRHYGNVLSGMVISVLVATGLQAVSSMVLGWLPGVLGEIPFLQIGIPAVLSVYFDVFSGCIQAYIFAMLTMLYVSGAFPMADYFARKQAKKDKKDKKQLKNQKI